MRSVAAFLTVDDEVQDPVQKKPKNAEKQKGAKKMLQLGHNEKEVASSGYKRSGSGAKRDRNVEDVNVEKEEGTYDFQVQACPFSEVVHSLLSDS